MKKIVVLFVMMGFLLSSSLSVEACIEDVPIKDRGPIRIICNMTLENTSCTHNDIDGDYSVDISSIQIINEQAYLRIKGLEQYTGIMNEAIDVWNVYNWVHLEINNDVYDVEFLRENLGDNQVLARYIYTGKINYIVINTFYFNDLTQSEQVQILIHELGHALGLDDNLHLGSIMNQGLSEGKEISDVDLRNLHAVIEELGNA